MQSGHKFPWVWSSVVVIVFSVDEEESETGSQHGPHSVTGSARSSCSENDPDAAIAPTGKKLKKSKSKKEKDINKEKPSSGLFKGLGHMFR